MVPAAPETLVCGGRHLLGLRPARPRRSPGHVDIVPRRQQDGHAIPQGRGERQRVAEHVRGRHRHCSQQARLWPGQADQVVAAVVARA